MSKRFQKTRIVDKWGGIYDSKTDKVLSVNDVEHKLNELAEENGILNKNEDDLEECTIENIKLKEEIKLLKPTNIEQYEQIQKLQKENEQLRAINKKIGDDLYNCRLNKNIIMEKLKLWQDVHKEYNIYSIKDFEELMKNDK